MGDFLPTNNWKNENLKKWKKATWRYHVKQVYQKSCYTVPEIWHVTDVIFIFYFGLSFYFTPLTTQKIKIKKKRKIEIQSFYLFVPKIKIKWCTFPEIFCATNGQMDRWRPHLKSTDNFFFSNNSSSATKKRLFKLFERKMPFRQPLIFHLLFDQFNPSFSVMQNFGPTLQCIENAWKKYCLNFCIYLML